MGHAAHEHYTVTGIDNRKFAMWTLIGSECFLFGTLMINYILNKASTKINDPEIAQKLIDHGKDAVIAPFDVYDIDLTTISTFVLLMSSVAMVLALDGCVRKNLRNFRLWTWVVIFFGLMFLGFQAYEFNHFMHKGLTLSANNFGASFYLLTGCHGLHVAVGVMLLTSVLIRSYLQPDWFDSVVVEVLGLYWHFVDVIWIIIFTVVYLLVYV